MPHWHQILMIFIIYALLSQNFAVRIYALFRQIFGNWKVESADFFTFRMYVATLVSESETSRLVYLEHNLIKVREMPTTGSHTPLWGGSCWLQDGSLLVRDSQGQTSSKCGYICFLYLKFRFWMLWWRVHSGGSCFQYSIQLSAA